MPPAGAASAPRLVQDVCEQGESLLTVLFPHLAGLRVRRVEDIGHAVVISASCRAGEACCPRCGQRSARVHGGYWRVVADGAAGGRPVLIVLRVRRFRCRNPACPAVTFAEQAEGLTARYRRRSVPLLGMLAGFGLELAGRAGARLAGTLGIAVHPGTVLRLVMALPDPPVTAAPQVTGVDDFALRKGHVYGTVVADAESGDVIDLLPDREAATTQSWLTAHPGAEVICRDRAGAYAEGAAAGAPGAIQVADRWHLWHNLGEHVEKAVAAHRGCLEGPGPQPPPRPTPASLQAAAAAAAAARMDASPLVTRIRRQHQQVRQLRSQGADLAGVMAATGLARTTALRYWHASSAEDLLAKAPGRRGSVLDPFKPYLDQRWAEGCTSFRALHAEITARGYPGSYRRVQDYLQPFRALTPAPAKPAPPPKTSQIARWLLSRPDRLDPDDQARLAAITASCPHLDALAGHVRSFATMMARRQGLLALDGWLTTVEADDQPELHSFAAGIRRDQQAVTAGLALPHSSAAMEGNVNKIKMMSSSRGHFSPRLSRNRT
jgi:transposase